MKVGIISLFIALLLALPAFAGPVDPCADPTGLPNSDGDTLRDDCDNCYLITNQTQTDTDGDGCGNVCDADFNNDGIVAIGDFSVLAIQLNGPPVGPPVGNTDIAPDPPDGIVAIGDFSALAVSLNGPPGPSGLYIVKDPVACPWPSSP